MQEKIALAVMPHLRVEKPSLQTVILEESFFNPALCLNTKKMLP
jgi:hypothetical protein